MKIGILLDVLFDLLNKKKLTANDLCEKFDFSSRTAWRYIRLLSQHVPLVIKRGRSGGVFLPDSFQLPKGLLSKEEHEATIRAIESAYARTPNPFLLRAKHKLCAQVKREEQQSTFSGDIGEFFIEESSVTFADVEKFRLLEESIKQRIVLQLHMGKSAEPIEPHALLLRKNCWFVFAYCTGLRQFQLFALNTIHALTKTQTHFRRRPFSRKDLPAECAKLTPS